MDQRRGWFVCNVGSVVKKSIHLAYRIYVEPRCIVERMSDFIKIFILTHMETNGSVAIFSRIGITVRCGKAGLKIQPSKSKDIPAENFFHRKVFPATENFFLKKSKNPHLYPFLPVFLPS